MRDVNTLKGLHGLRTMLSSKKRSISRIHNSAHLDLYMLNKEKERLLKESKRLGMRDADIKRRMKEIDQEMTKLRESESSDNAGANPGSSGRASTQKNGAGKEWKKMSLNY